MAAASTQSNPFLAPSTLPFGYPDFDAIREEHFLPAFTVGMAEQRAEVDAITAGPPSFDGTVVALERSGATLRRVSAVFRTLVSSASTPGIRAIDAEVAPLLAAHEDAITLDPALFARLDALHAERARLDLGPEALRLLERRHRDAVRAGARLGSADQERLRALNAELAALSAEFGTRLLAEANDSAVVVDDPARLAGLAPDAVAAAARAAAERGHDGAHVLALALATEQPVLASLADRELRERVHRASTARGARGGPYDARDLVRRISALRAERARVLGHPHHASWVAEDSTAGTVEAIDAMLRELVPPAVANARAEAEALAAAAGHPIEPWDRAFFAERVRRERFDLDAAALRPYFELERVLRDGVFYAAQELYGLRFTERHDLPRHHPQVRTFDVHDADGPLGLFVADLYARPAKRGGAWMNSFVAQSRLLGTRPVVLNTANLAAPAAGPTLLTVDEVRTLFHEFGHALHGLLSDVEYPTFSGTSVPRDFVEYPSQVNEMWMLHPEVLANYARHHETGEPIPAEVVDRLRASRRFGEGFRTTEYLAATLLDQAWHRLGPAEEVADVERFEADALAAAAVAVPSAPPRYRSTYFNHVFGGAYSAGYYAYIWSEVLDADTVEWFTENGGLCRESGEIFRQRLLARGGAVEPMDAYRAFRGRDPEIGPLLARRGLARSTRPGPR
jgi:peptidyl-dipeptidase Dcp